MSVLLYVIGAIAVMVGVGMVAFGIPINEFSFGNTLIGAGFTAATGGLIILALGVVVGQLHRLAEALAARPPARAGRPSEGVEVQAEPPMAPSAPARAPPPSRQRSERAVRDVAEPRIVPHGGTGAPHGAVGEEQTYPYLSPALRNPEAPPLAVDDDISLSPDTPRTSRSPSPPGANGGGPEQGHQVFPPPWRGPSPREVPPANFDAMWPAEPRGARMAGGEPPLTARAEGLPRETMPPPTPEPSSPSPPRAVAVLKSGVVDGMGYTLYVDGSIEAELPQGVLRFGSIEELRTHLEKNG